MPNVMPKEGYLYAYWIIGKGSDHRIVLFVYYPGGYNKRKKFSTKLH